MAHDARAIMAAKNNADLYQAMFETHGRQFLRRPHAFVGIDTPPPYYANVTVSLPGCVDEVIGDLKNLARESAGGLGLKDSFCEFDLGANGFETLFEASWIWKSPETKAIPTNWFRITHSKELEDWEAAWKLHGSPTEQRMFNDAILRRSDTAFFGERNGSALTGGCIATISSDCIGISNVFGASKSPRLFGTASDAVASLGRSLPIVGYEAGPELEAARNAGFKLTGNLRVLIASTARF